MNSLKCGFIGLGLIGGSIVKALKYAAPAVKIIAYDPKPDGIIEAKEEGFIDEVADEINASFSDCDYIFLCAPVKYNDENLMTLKEFLSPKTIVTDVGSVKTDIHKHVIALNLDHCFIGGHPMAGSEKVGFSNSTPAILKNSYYIYTPASKVPEEAINRFHQLIESLGAIPLLLDYEEHDYVTAAISHLPHVISASLVNLVKDSDTPDNIMRLIAAGGFKDITRISSSSPVMWQNICLTNSNNILILLENYIGILQKIKQSINYKNSDALYYFFAAARSYRNTFGERTAGPLPELFFFSLDIKDEPGSLAKVVQILGDAGINIANINITHNREFDQGALRIDFDNKDDMENAHALLSQHGYFLHHKQG